MNETIYWIIEYIKVIPAYAFIMFLWPLAVFHKFLKDKSRTYKFSLCVVSMITIINMSVLMLGTLHVLNVWVIRILFYGAFLFVIVKRLNISKERVSSIKHMTAGTMGKKTFVQRFLAGIKRILIYFLNKAKEFFKGNIVAYAMMILIVLYGVLYFSWSGFQDFSYGASDMYVHHEWIYNLVKGEPFSGGIYPEGMHCFIYMINALFGIKIYSGLMYVAGIHSAVTIVSAYVLFKEIFKWKYTPILVMALFLILDVRGNLPIMSMSRMTWTLPQEFAYPTVFLCGAYLISYLKRKDENSSLKNEKLLIFMLALAGSISIHFYATIMAFFVCLMIVLPLIPKLFKNKNFRNLFAAVVLGVVIAFIPMLAALATGKKFQGSIDWAIGLIKDTIAYENHIDTDSIRDKAIEIVTGNQGVSVELALKGNDKNAVVRSIKKAGDKMPFSQRRQDIYLKTYVLMHGADRAPIIIAVQVLAVLIWLICKIGFSIIKINKKDTDTGRYDGYLMVALVSAAFILLNNSTALGLPELIEAGRLSAMAQFFSVSLFFVPIDLILSFPYYKNKLAISAGICVAAMFLTVFLTIKTGNYHSYLYYNLGRYNGAVNCAISIIKDTRPEEFTIVSTTEEYYQIIDCGYHEELIDFVNSAYYEDTYTLPTKYVFIYLEKKPIKYPHAHFPSGPKWLALENYPSYHGEGVSQAPEIYHSEITDEMAETDYGKFVSGTIKEYSHLERRTLVESKVYGWCKEFEKLYPGVLKTYYEDDYFVCYYFEQNQRSTYELSIKK